MEVRRREEKGEIPGSLGRSAPSQEPGSEFKQEECPGSYNPPAPIPQAFSCCLDQGSTLAPKEASTPPLMGTPRTRALKPASLSLPWLCGA